MPLSTFWGATIDRTVPGQITLALDGVSVTVAWDGTKATKSDIKAAFILIDRTIQVKLIATNDLWDYRCQYARFAWKALDYNDIAATLPANQRKPYTDKSARMATIRDQYKTLAGE